ncbi:DMT family transporter [Flagellimonas zhangzhouensis]|uniref:Permease of the drug/metabolite transporter (DMT) superfamily n=1 Tax=Flagellimonas zhangzhouensis TaxID=1073328 RepID=A0A1H2YLP4_9FLAO|nr:DMT family transporter [Allomuricauda zhangzhouensis]SDR01769.1 Permease of the drug/metabolite transporter (DMT) superfamily [Allomuricauda zhangzhouensis]SDX06132.1 Permease of the drug/metabolite transporter (DMT) superfamily [Allomuricauda zhangzhouensis]
MLKERQQGLVAILTANIIFGLNTPVTKELMDHWMSPIGYTITRMFFGAALFWLVGLFLKSEKVDKKDMWTMIIGGLMGFIGTQLLFSQALEYTTPVIYSLLMALTPVVVLILSAIFLKEGIPSRKILGIIISISGAGLIIYLSGSGGPTGSNNGLGILLAILCVFCYAGYLTLTRKISMKYNPITIAKWMFLVSAIAALPLTFNGGLEHQEIYSESGTVWAYSLLLFSLLFSTTLAFFLMPYALKRLEASTASIFMNLQPIVASVVAIAVGQDRLTWDKPLAAFLVILGVYLVTYKKRKEVAPA